MTNQTLFFSFLNWFWGVGNKVRNIQNLKFHLRHISKSMDELPVPGTLGCIFNMIKAHWVKTAFKSVLFVQVQGTPKIVQNIFQKINQKVVKQIIKKIVKSVVKKNCPHKHPKIHPLGRTAPTNIFQIRAVVLRSLLTTQSKYPVLH